MGVTSTEFLTQGLIDLQARLDVSHDVIADTLHDLFTVPPDVAGAGHRDRFQGVMVTLHLSPQRLTQTQHVIPAVDLLLLRQLIPGIADLVVIVGLAVCLWMGDVHFRGPGSQTHICEQVAAAKLYRAVVHGSFEDVPAADCKNLLRLEIIDCAEVDPFKRQVVHVDHKFIVIIQRLPDPGKHEPEIVPRPAVDRFGVQANLQLPVIQMSLLAPRQRCMRGFYVERAQQVFDFPYAFFAGIAHVAFGIVGLRDNSRIPGRRCVPFYPLDLLHLVKCSLPCCTCPI